MSQTIPDASPDAASEALIERVVASTIGVFDLVGIHLGERLGPTGRCATRARRRARSSLREPTSTSATRASGWSIRRSPACCWRNLRLLSSAGNTYTRDYLGETPDGDQQHIVNVFVSKDGEVRHFWASELRFLPDDDRQDNRCADFIWPLWPLLATPDGRGTDPDLPKLSYR